MNFHKACKEIYYMIWFDREIQYHEKLFLSAFFLSALFIASPSLLWCYKKNFDFEKCLFFGGITWMFVLAFYGCLTKQID
jgi:hypothetical protein